jgi:hypothetical protein
MATRLFVLVAILLFFYNFIKYSIIATCGQGEKLFWYKIE